MAAPAQKIPDVASIMAEIRAKVTADIARSKDRKQVFKPLTANIDAGAEFKAGALLHSEELRNLNRGHAFSLKLNPATISSHRAGFVGKIVVKIKRKLMVMFRDTILKEYLQSEHEFQANLVRYLNTLTRYIDNRDGSNFWELVRKIDVDITKALDRIERINDDQTATLRTTERSLHDSLNSSLKEVQRYITDLQAKSAQVSNNLTSIDHAVKGLESIAAQLGSTQTNTITASPTQSVDRSYLLFENRFRGSENEIRQRLKIYPEIFKGSSQPVLEIGPGRGELQKLFKEANVPSYGVDSDTAMVQSATAAGHKIIHGDGIAHLAEARDSSLGGLIAIQVIEHLPAQVLRDLLAAAKRKIAPGGKVVFETINPQSMLALSSNYFRDPTHVAPQHPDTVKYTMELFGFKNCEIRYLSPVPMAAQLKEIAFGEFMTPRWELTINSINENIKQLNGLLYGYQDFCIIGEV